MQIPKNSFLACRLSVCLSVDTITKNNWASSTKFGMRSYMIKISVGIAYEQNRPTGVATALRAQFGFGAKSALKMHCTKNFFRQKLLQITIHNFWCKNFFDRPTDVASALKAQFGFLVKSALKMRCTNFFLPDKSCYKLKFATFMLCNIFRYLAPLWSYGGFSDV